MKILSVECSAAPAGVAVFEDGKKLAEGFTNVKITHSQTLMPMIENTLKAIKLSLSDIDCFAVSSGPGSFTGIRIGISAVKGLSIVNNTPCVSVSTLLAMAYGFIDRDLILCPVMDARCNQFYNALFKIKDGVITRLSDDRAVMGDELFKELNEIEDDVVICGDGAELFFDSFKFKNNIKLSHPKDRYQSAVGVALAAEVLFGEGKTVSSEELIPFYLRLPQAERELKAKNNKEKI